MDKYILDIYLDDVNREYLNKLTFLSLFKSRSLGYRCAADLFSEAYRNYDSDICQETLATLQTWLVCNYIIDRYEIAYREDLVYLIRHPSLIPNKMDPNQKTVRKKVLQFLDLEKEENAFKRDAYNYLDKMRPVKRAAQIDKILEQFLILTENEYYITQAAARLMNDIVKTTKFDETGNVIGINKNLIDTIWRVGSAHAPKAYAPANI